MRQVNFGQFVVVRTHAAQTARIQNHAILGKGKVSVSVEIFDYFGRKVDRRAVFVLFGKRRAVGRGQHYANTEQHR